MTATNHLLDKYAETRSMASDNAIGASLGVKRQAVHQWRKGTSWPTDAHIMAMAEAIGASPEGWMAAIQADKSKDPGAQKAWKHAAKSLGWAAAITLTCATLSNPAKATTTQAICVPINQAILYIM